MPEEPSELFREKAVKTIESPESMNDYLHVTSPGVWVLLVAVVVILAGVIIWGTFGRIETTCPAAVVSEAGSSWCLVPAEELESVIENRTIVVDGRKLELDPVTTEATVITDETSVYIRLAGDYEVGDVVYPVQLTESLEDGIASGTLICESLSPMSLLLN